MNKNGYNSSVFNTIYGECFFCQFCTDTARHEVFYGTANRQKAKRLGYWVNLCPECHMKVHDDPNNGIDMYLKKRGQKIYEQDHTREQFIKEWGRSYL